MALGSGGLGTLTLYINADTSDFDQAINYVEQKARAFGTRFNRIEQQLDLTPQVDDSQLTALNKHLSLKQQHFQQVGRFMQQSPIAPRVRMNELEGLRAELKEVADLQRQTARQFEQNPINLPRITIAPRINNRTVNEAPKINTRITAPDLRLSGTVNPKVTVSNRVSSNFQNNASVAKGVSASPEKTKAQLRQVENQLARLDQTEVTPRLDVESIERFTKRIAELEAQVDRLNEKAKAKPQESSGAKAVLDATAKALPSAADKVADGIGTGISQGLSQAIPVFAGKMGEATSDAIVTAIARTVTPAIKINTPEIKFQTSFTDIVRAGRELAGAGSELKDAAKEVGKKEKQNPILGFLGRVGGSILTGIGQGVGGRISTGIVAGIENKLEIKFRDAAEAAVVVLADGLEEALGFQFKAVGDFVKEQAPEVFNSGQTTRKKVSKSAPQQPTTSIENAITYLASQDDGAVAKDRKGFNKLDSQRGRDLAEKIKLGQKLTQEEAKAALQMLLKYRKQLAEAQQGSLPEWDKIAAQYAQVAQETPASSQAEQEQIMRQLEQLKTQLKALDEGADPQEVGKQVALIQETERQLQSIISQKQKDLIEAMMSAQEITISTLKPIGQELGLPDINKPRKDGGYSKEQLVKEVVGRSDPDTLRKRLPFIPVPVASDVVAESEQRASMSPEQLRRTLGSKRNAIANAVLRNPGQKSGNELADINNVIEKERQVINNLLSRDLNNTAKKYLKKQKKALLALSDQLVNESLFSPNVSTQLPQTQTDDISSPNVDQMRSQASAVQNTIGTITSALEGLQSLAGTTKSSTTLSPDDFFKPFNQLFQSFTNTIKKYADELEETFDLVGLAFDFLVDHLMQKSELLREVVNQAEQLYNTIDQSFGGAIDPTQGLPSGVGVSENNLVNKNRTYNFQSQSGKNVGVYFSNKKNSSDVFFDIDGKMSTDAGAELSQKEKDAIALKVLKIIKHDAKTRKEGYQYRTEAFGDDDYGAARAEAYEKVGFSRPLEGIAGKKQFAVVQNGKIAPDNTRVSEKELRLGISQEQILANIEASQKLAAEQKKAAKSRTRQQRTSATVTPDALVEQMRSNASTARGGIFGGDLFGPIIKSLQEFIQSIQAVAQEFQTTFDFFGSMFMELFASIPDPDKFETNVKVMGDALDYLVDDVVKNNQQLQTAVAQSEQTYAQLGKEVLGVVDPSENLPSGVSVEENRLLNQKRDYSFKSKSGKDVVVNLSNKADHSDVAFTIDGRTDFKEGGLDQKEKDAIALKVLKIIKHDAKTRQDGYRYQLTAYNADNYGSARAQAYEKFGFTRPIGGKVGEKQFAVIRDGKIVPDQERVEGKESRLGISQEEIAKNTEEAQRIAAEQRKSQKSKKVTATDPTVTQLRSQVAAARGALEILRDAIATFATTATSFAGKIKDVLAGLLNPEGIVEVTSKFSDSLGSATQEAFSAAQAQIDKAKQLVENYTSKDEKQRKVKEVAEAIREKNAAIDPGQALQGDHEYETFFSAGFSGTGGYNPEVYSKITEALGAKHSVTPVFNPEYEADTSIFDDAGTHLASITKRIAEAGGQGVNPVSKQMADQAYQAWLRDPDKKIRFAGYSAGAHVASDALEIFKQLAPTANAKAVGIGGAPFDYRRSNLSTSDYQNVIRQDDQLLRQVAGVAMMNGQHERLVTPTNDKGLTGALDAHLFDSYAKDDATIQAIKDALEKDSPQQEEKSHNAEDFYREALAKITAQAAAKSGIKLRPGQMPGLEFNDEQLKKVGARAQYNIKDNKLIVSSDVKKFFDALKTGTVSLNKYEQEVRDVVHELRHAFQYNFGRLNQGALMSGAKPGVMTPFNQTSRSARQYGLGEASSSYYQQFAKQTSNPEKFLQVIRDTEADAENFAEKWKELIQAAFTVDEPSMVQTATDAAKGFIDGLLSFARKPEATGIGAGEQISVNQNRGITGAIGANQELQKGFDSIVQAFNDSFDVFKGFEDAVKAALGAGSSTAVGIIGGIEAKVQSIQDEIESQANSLSQQGAEQTVRFLDELEGRLDVEVENLENFIAHVRQKTGGRADPALDVVQEQFGNKISTIKASINQARTGVGLNAGIIQAQNPDQPRQLNKFQAALEGIRKVAKNVREEIKAINAGENLNLRMVKGSAADLGVNLSDEEAKKIAGQNGNFIKNAQRASDLAQSAIAGNWKDVFEELLDEIDEFTDAALERFADFVEGIPGGNVFAKVIRGAKEFKGVIFSFIGLKMAWEGLVHIKHWLDSFDEVFVDAAVGWERFERLLSFSSKTFGQAQANIKFVRDEAVRLGTDLKQSMQGFSQLSAASIDTGMEGTGTKQLFSAVNQASSAYGLDSEGQNRVYTALSQMMSKNTVSSEELKQQLGEILPGSFQIAARAAGKTTQEFTALLETGQILAEDFLPKFAQQLSAETAAGVAGAASSAQGATNRFNNSLLELQVSLGKFGIDERNLFLNAVAGMMDFAAKNAVVLSYAMGSLLAGAIWALGGAFKVFLGRLVQAAAAFLMTRLGITTLGLSFKTLGATIAASLRSFLLLSVVVETISMIKGAMTDASGKSRDFANSMGEAYGKIAASIAEARGELDKFNAAQGKGKDKQQKVVGRDSIIDEAPLLSWLLPKEINKNDGWFNKARFSVRNTVVGATEGLGFLTNPIAAINAVRKNDRTLAPTYGNKKFQDQKRATTEILDIANKSSAVSAATLNDKELQKVKAYDEQLRQIQIKRRGIVQVDPGNKKDLNELKRQEEKILADREKAYKPLGNIQASNQIAIQGIEAEIEKYKELIAKSESDLATAATPRDKKDIQARLDYYRQTLPQLEGSLKKVQDSQDALTKSIGESVDKFILLQKQLQNVADRLADANDRIQMIGNSAKSQVSQAVAGGQMTPGQGEFAKGKIEREVLADQLQRKKGAINEYQGLLFGADAQAILESRGIKNINDVGQAQLGTLASKAKDGTPEKEVFTRLQDMKKLEVEASELQAQLDAAKEQAAQQIRDANKQIMDYFRDISRQSAELALSTKEAQAQIALQQQKNKLKSALQGFQDNFFSSFVDSLIEGMDSLNEPIMASIEKERDIQSANFAQEDRNRQTAELYKSLPLDTQSIKLDFSAIDSAPVKELQSSLEKSAQASKSVTDASKATGAAIGDSAKEAGNLQQNVSKVEGDVQGVKSATDNVSTALQDNVGKAQQVNTELQNNKDATDNNRIATEGVNDAITTQAQKIFESMDATEQSIGGTNQLKAAWDFVVAGVVDVTAKTWEWFKGLGQNVPFISQFGDLIGDWGKKIQDVIGKTWEWLKGLGDNIPFLQQIGSTIQGWGQAVADSPVGQAVGNAWNQGVSTVQSWMGQGGGAGSKGIIKPSSGPQTSGYGMRWGRLHDGVDYGIPVGSAVKSTMAGTIAKIGYEAKGAGNYVIVQSIDSMGRKIEQTYMHLSKVLMKVGDQVGQGQQFAESGNTGRSTGPHLHWRVRINGKSIDPNRFLQSEANIVVPGSKTDGKLTAKASSYTEGADHDHHPGDGHNHGTQQYSPPAPSGPPTPRAAGGSLPNLGAGYGSIQKFQGILAQNPYYNTSTPEGRARLAITSVIGGSEMYGKGSTGTDFFNSRGGTGNNMLGALQYNLAYHNSAINTPQKYVNFSGEIFAGKRALPNGRKGQDFGAALNQAIASGQIKNGSDMVAWMRKSGLGGSNWQGVDDGIKRIPGLADAYVNWLKSGGAGGSPVPQGMPTASSAPAAQAKPMFGPVPFASMAGGQQYSSTSVNTAPLTEAQKKSDAMAAQQRAQAAAKEKARVDQARVDGEQRQRQRLEQARQNLLELNKDSVQMTRQFRDMGYDTQLQTPGLEAARKQMGINDTYDDLEKDVAEKVRRTQAGRDQAAATLQKLSSPDYVPQPGQDVAKDAQAAKAAVEAADQYLGKLKSIQGDLKKQREDKLKFEAEQTAREKALAEQQAKFGTEEIDISKVEAELDRLKQMQSRGIRDQGVENIPKLEAMISARREELQVKQKLSEIDENIRKNQDNPTIVAELNKQKTGLQDRLKIVQETISANRTYAEEVMKRENAKTAREAANAQAQAELETLKQQLQGLQQVAQVNPNAEGVDQIPQLEEAIGLKELELKLTNDLAAAEQERFENKINDDQYKKRVEEIQKENQLAKENVFLKRRQAEVEAAIARKRNALGMREQDMEVTGSVKEALSKNIEYGRSQGDPISMRFEQQREQQKLNFEKQMLDLEELEASGKRTKEEIDKLRESYQKLNNISLDNLAVEQQRATEDRIMEISGRMTGSRTGLLNTKADYLSSLGLDTQARQFRKQSAVLDQQQNYAQESLNLERFIAQMQIGSEEAGKMRDRLASINEISLKKIEKEFDPLNDVLKGFKDGVQSALSGLLSGQKTVGEAFQGLLDSMVNQLADMASKWVTDELFGGLFGEKGNETDAAKEASAIAAGTSANPLAAYSYANPLPVSVTNASALGGAGGAMDFQGMGGFAKGEDFLSGVLGGNAGFFGENLFGNNPLPVNMVQANDSVFSSLTDGIMGIFGGSGGGGFSGIMNIAGSLLGGLGGGGGMGGGFAGGLLSFIPNLLGFANGGIIGSALASGGVAGASLEENLEQAMARERSLNGGKKARVIVATDGELVVPTKVADRLSPKMRDFLIGRSGAPDISKMNYAQGGIVGSTMGSSIANNITNNMGGTTKIEGSTVNVGEGGSMSKEEALRLQKAIDASVMKTISQQRRPRGLLYS